MIISKSHGDAKLLSRQMTFQQLSVIQGESIKNLVILIDHNLTFYRPDVDVVCCWDENNCNDRSRTPIEGKIVPYYDHAS